MAKYNVSLEFEIISSFNPKDRLNELDEIPKIDGYTDYWKAAQLLCEKDGGRLPTIKELQLIAVLQKNKLINTNYSGYFWSSSVYTGYTINAWYVDFSSCNSYLDYNCRGDFSALCVRDVHFKQRRYKNANI